MHSGISVHRACFPFRFAILRKASGLHSQRTRGGIRTHIHVILSHIALPISAREHVMELQRRGLWILRATQLISPVLLFCCFSVLKPIYHSASCCATDFSVILQDSLSRRSELNRTHSVLRGRRSHRGASSAGSGDPAVTRVTFPPGTSR